MDYIESLKNIKTAYNKDMGADKTVAAIAKKQSKTYTDASKFASASGKHLGDALVDELVKLFPDGDVDEADLMALIPGALRVNYSELARMIQMAQEEMNTAAGVGLKPIVSAFDVERATGIAKELAERGSITGFTDKIIQQTENFSRGTVDESMRQNMEAQTGAGLETIVTRVYDGVGLHDGKQPCAWCLSRAGEWSYQEAIQNGVFERHPGCECEITYTTSKRSMRQTDWRRNQWEEVNRPAKIEARKNFGLDGGGRT